MTSVSLVDLSSSCSSFLNSIALTISWWRVCIWKKQCLELLLLKYFARKLQFLFLLPQIIALHTPAKAKPENNALAKPKESPNLCADLGNSPNRNDSTIAIVAMVANRNWQPSKSTEVVNVLRLRFICIHRFLSVFSKLSKWFARQVNSWGFWACAWGKCRFTEKLRSIQIW